MICVGIDSASKTAGVAVMRDGELLYESYLNAGLTHSQTLLPLLETALTACGLKAADVGLYAVCSGPGSFTGLRIGLALVKGLAFAANTPCAAVSTLDALARSYVGTGTIIPALDARRGEVYWAGFDLETHARLCPDDAAPVANLDNFVENCKKPIFFVGDGAPLCYNRSDSVHSVVYCPPALVHGRAAGVCLAGLALLDAGQCVAPAALLPSYHRLSQAERERAERLAASGPA